VSTGAEGECGYCHTYALLRNGACSSGCARALHERESVLGRVAPYILSAFLVGLPSGAGLGLFGLHLAKTWGVIKG